MTDGLTGLYNQRYFKQRLGEEVARAAEQGRPLALLFCDLDHFKDYNDRFGHTAGDEALRAVANVLLRSVRQVDLAARYGGEEFTVVLIDSTAQRAAEIAERIRAGVAALELGEPDRGLSVSIGVAAYPRDAALGEELIDKADWAMYLAKRQGRDRVVVFGPGETGGPTDDSGGAAGPSDFLLTASTVDRRIGRRADRRRVELGSFWRQATGRGEMRVGKADGEAWLRLSEAADLLGISLNTLRRWSDSGKIACYRSPGGHRRYRRADVEALLRRQSSGRPQERGAGLAALTSPAATDARFATARPALATLAQAAAEGIGVTSCILAATDGDGRLRVVASHAGVEKRPGDAARRRSSPARAPLSPTKSSTPGAAS